METPGTKHVHPAYRADIDGLRAVAVLLVIFEHIHTRIKGGYIGVDVFFVISGYLISGTMLREMNAGSFSIAGFYERRVRRIFPALLVMLIGTSLLTLHYFVPSEIEAFAWSLLSALFSVSNLFFSHYAGYFDAPSALKPLLHTWSLAVEEQFYIFFPLFLACIRRWLPARIREAVWLGAGATFVLACFWVRRDATVAFFLAPLRAWELLLGTIVSQRYVLPNMGKMLRNGVGLIGLALVLVPALLYTDQTPFPGLAALPPCMGTALIIYAGETGPTVVNRLLAIRPLVFVGLISYSLYLWHWPILVFQKTGYMLLDAAPDSKQVKVAVFLASVVAGTLSWQLVEKPFRKGRLRPARRSLFVITGSLFVSLLAVVAVMLYSHGFSKRFPAEALKIDAYTRYEPGPDFRQGTCFLESNNTFADFRKSSCIAPDFTDRTARPQYLLFGDSHAAHLYHGLSTVFPEIHFLQATAASCRPFISKIRERGTCADLMKYIFEDVLANSHPDAVLLAGHWQENELEDLGETIAWLQRHGQKVILFGPIMEYTEPLPRLLTFALRDHDLNTVDQHRDMSVQGLDKKMTILADERWHVRYISAFRDLCAAKVEMTSRSEPGPPPECPIYAAPGVPLLFDTDHLTPAGSVLYAQAMRDQKQLP